MSRRIITSKLSKVVYNFKTENIVINNSIRCLSETVVNEEWTKAKPYSEIPGPKPWPIPNFGNAWRFTPFGNYYGLSITDVFLRLSQEFGNIVKLGGLGQVDIVLISDPNDIEKVYRNEGPWPSRKAFEVFEYYRQKVRPEVFQGNSGLLTSQGEKWKANRTAVNQPYMRPQNMILYHKAVEEVTDDFIERMKKIRDDKLEMPKDFSNEIRKWSLEASGLIAFDKRMGCLEDNFSENDEPQMFINAVHDLFDLIHKVEFQPSLWRYYSTKNWRKLVKTMDFLTDISLKHTNMKKEELARRGSGSDVNSEEVPSILEVLIKQNPDSNMPTIMAIDTLSAGVDTISHSVSNILYNLSKNPESQEKLYEELRELLPSKNDKLPKNFENSARYLKASFKESQRLTPVVQGNQRHTVDDIVLCGYQIPKDTFLSLLPRSVGKDDKNYPNPKKFFPERWLLDKTSADSAKNAHPFAFLPFGFGPRMCIGRRMAELLSYIIIAKIIRNFKISYNYGEMTYNTNLLQYPNKPLQFRLEDREN